MKIMPKAFGHETTLTSGSNLGHIAPFINPPSGYITFFPIITNSVANWDFSIMGHFTFIKSFYTKSILDVRSFIAKNKVFEIDYQ